MAQAHLSVFRGTPETGGEYVAYDVPAEEGMVVLDALHWIQANEAPDLAVRWNCKAAKCGSCGCEINGKPSLACKSRLSDFEPDETITVEPLRTFPLIRDLVTDVSWNYEVNKRITPFTPPTDTPQADWRWGQEDIERVQEFRKCIECFLCQDVCHVLRNHETERPFMGPRYLVRTAGLEMHPMDQADRTEYLKDQGGVGYCNITKCCTEVCPEHIRITDNAIIPLKERVADRYYDPIQFVWRKLRGDRSRNGSASVSRAGENLPMLPGGPRAGAPDAAAGANHRPDVGVTGAAGDAAGGCRRQRSGQLSGTDREPDPTLWPPPQDVADDADERATGSTGLTTGSPTPPTDPARAGASQPGLRLIIRTDGAARSNPGPASAGAVLIDATLPGARDPLAPPLASISDYLGVQTNNVAEYTAVVRALGLAAELGASEVDLLLDSKLIVEQVHGRWRVKDAKLQPLHAEVRRRLAGFRRWTAVHVPRAQNSAADAMCNEAIDRALAGGPASVVRRP